MKNKAEAHCKHISSYLLISSLLFLTACAGASGAVYTAMTDRLNTEMSNVERSGDASSIDNYKENISDTGSTINYEDDLVKFEFPKSGNFYYMAVEIQNKSNSTIYIDWDEVGFIDSEGDMNDILKDGVKFERKSEKGEEWNNGTTALESGDREVHAFIPFSMFRVESDQGYGSDPSAFTCKGKPYEFKVTSMDFVQGGFDNPDKCSVLREANMTVLQFANYTEPKGKNFSIIIPIRVGEKTAKYNMEFFVNSTK